MRYLLIILIFPFLLSAQEFRFQQEFDTIPVEIDGWRPYQPWVGGYNYSQPDFCDIDSDQDLDLFIGKFWPNYFDYYQNIGISENPQFILYSFNWDSIYSISSRSNTDYWDLDCDGDMDLLVGSGYVRYYNNEGTCFEPDFTGYSDTLLDISGNLVFGTHVSLRDIDSDGDADLICGEYQGHLQFYRNIGTPDSFDFYLESNPWLNINVYDDADPTFCDIDSDGDLDLFIGNEFGKIWYYQNVGTTQQYDFVYVTNNYANIDVGERASPEFADIDGDGDYDLFVGRAQESSGISPGDIFFYENTGTAQIPQWNLVTKNYICLDVGYFGYSTTTDIDADLERDLFIQNAGDRLSFYKNIGTIDSPSYYWVTDSYQDISVEDASPEFGDLDSDGDFDLLMGEAAIPGPPGIYLFDNIGTPQVANFSLVTNDLIPGVFTQYTVRNSITLADIDADGDLDLFSGSHDEAFYYFQNIGTSQNPVFSLVSDNWQNIYGPTTPDNPFYSCFYDIDHDNDLDLFLSSLYDFERLWFYRNIGTPQNAQMSLETETFLGEEGNFFFQEFDIFDIDNDGDGDFLISIAEGGGVVFFRNLEFNSVNREPLTVNRSFALLPNYPNPFNASTTIPFTLDQQLPVKVVVYNQLGQVVWDLGFRIWDSGENKVVWNARGVSSGVYLIRLTVDGGQSMVKPVILLK